MSQRQYEWQPIIARTDAEMGWLAQTLASEGRRNRKTTYRGEWNYLLSAALAARAPPPEPCCTRRFGHVIIGWGRRPSWGWLEPRATA